MQKSHKNKTTKPIKPCFASFSCWLSRLRCTGRINHTLSLINAGFFDDIGNGIAGAANDVADFTVDAQQN
jgi:hypothetical protein